MSRPFTVEAGAALVFLVLYLFIFVWMLWAYQTHRIKWKSRYSMVFFHVTVRLASQACGIAFGILAFDNTDVFLAYLILGAEGYFTLVLCAYRFLISWHQHNLPNHESWLEPRDPPGTNKTQKALIMAFLWPIAWLFYPNNTMVLIHTLLVIANGVIVSGGSFLAGTAISDTDPDELARKLNISKILRTSGQSVFLAINAFLMISIIQTILKDKRQIHSRPNGRVHPTLWILLAAWFPLIVRGIFGVLQAAVYRLSYTNPENYTGKGFTHEFSAIEYCLGVLPEWLGCLLLISTYYTSRKDPSKGEWEAKEKEKEKQEKKEGPVYDNGSATA